MKLTYLAHVVEIAIIAFLLLHIFVLAPTQSQSSSLNVFSLSFSNPPDLQREINSSKDILADLSSLGCKLVNVSIEGSQLQSGLSVNYSDFRCIAYNTKLVFYAEVPSVGTGFVAFYQGMAIGFEISETEGGSFTRFEKLQFTSAYATSDSSNYYAMLTVKNTGTTTATIDAVFLNGQPYTNWQFSNNTVISGAAINGTVIMPKSASWTSGMTVEVKIQTEAGDQYPQVIVLP